MLESADSAPVLASTTNVTDPEQGSLPLGDENVAVSPENC
jgi:hypothetical protein